MEKDLRLRRCPFCKSNRVDIAAYNVPMGGTVFFVGCNGLGKLGADSCQAHGPVRRTSKAAAQAWNRRALSAGRGGTHA